MNKVKEQKSKKDSSKNFFEVLLSRIQEASSIMQYSFLLPKISIVLGQNEAGFSESVEQIATAVYQNCSYFLNDYNYNVFGYKEFDCPDLSLLSMHSDFWNHIFKQDMILSTFDKLRKIIAESCPINNYQMTRYSNLTNYDDEYDFVHHGFDYLSGEGTSTNENHITLQLSENKNSLNIMSNRKEIYVNSKSSSDEELSSPTASHAPNSKRRIINLHNKLNEAHLSLEPFFLQPHISAETSSLYKVSLLEFYQYTVYYKGFKDKTRDASSILPILNAHNSINFSIQEYNNYKNSMYRLLSNISLDIIDGNLQPDKKPITHKLLLSDKIYLRYQIEKLFSPILIDCMYQNTVNTKGKKHTLTEHLSTIATCSLLPNVFTRHYILQMCLDTIYKHFNYDFRDSYFFTRFKESPRAFATYSNNEAMSSYIKLQVLMDRYYEFMNYLGRFIFPVIENYFFCTLWGNYSSSFPDETPAQIALNIYFRLRKYLNNPKIVHELFKTEDIILSSKTEKPKLKSSHIIKPNFSIDKETKPDTLLYHNCIMACSPEPNEPLIPDFISLNYLDEIVNDPRRHMQAFYAKSIRK